MELRRSFNLGILASILRSFVPGIFVTIMLSSTTPFHFLMISMDCTLPSRSTYRLPTEQARKKLIAFDEDNDFIVVGMLIQ